MSTLFDSLKLGDLKVPNRIFMAPLTRSRAGAERIPNAMMAQYYSQRASAGLIVSGRPPWCRRWGSAMPIRPESGRASRSTDGNSPPGPRDFDFVHLNSAIALGMV